MVFCGTKTRKHGVGVGWDLDSARLSARSPRRTIGRHGVPIFSPVLRFRRLWAAATLVYLFCVHRDTKSRLLMNMRLKVWP